MGHDVTKLVYSEGKPLWLMPDGSFVPAVQRNDGSVVQGRLYIKDRSAKAPRLIRN